MYHAAPAATVVGTSLALPYTGLNVVWAALAGFALLTAGLAVRRIAPKRIGQ